MKDWQKQMSDMGLNMSQIELKDGFNGPDGMIKSNTTTHYVVIRAPAPDSEQVVGLLSAQPQVDWIEKTPDLSFWNKWAKGITQSGDWQVRKRKHLV